MKRSELRQIIKEEIQKIKELKDVDWTPLTGKWIGQIAHPDSPNGKRGLLSMSQVKLVKPDSNPADVVWKSNRTDGRGGGHSYFDHRTLNRLMSFDKKIGRVGNMIISPKKLDKVDQLKGIKTKYINEEKPKPSIDPNWSNMKKNISELDAIHGGDTSIYKDHKIWFPKNFKNKKAYIIIADKLYTDLKSKIKGVSQSSSNSGMAVNYDLGGGLSAHLFSNWKGHTGKSYPMTISIEDKSGNKIEKKPGWPVGSKEFSNMHTQKSYKAAIAFIKGL